MQEVSAIVVARKGSIRVPNKNKLPIGGQPMFIRKILQLKACSLIDRVIFGSDDEAMLENAADLGAEIIHRPDYFCDEAKASANDMIANMMDSIRTDVVVWAHCTNPLISSNTYDNALQAFLSKYPEYDSLISVVELKEHLWHEVNGKKEPLNYNPWASRHVPARDLPPYYMQDGGIFIQPYEQMRDNRYFFGKSPYLFLLPKEEFLDVNEQRDYILANAIVGE